MADLLHVAARLRALQNGQAVPIVSQRQVVIQPHAKILTLISMAGEDTSVHAAAYGGFGETFMSFDRKAVTLLSDQGEAAQLLI